MGCDEILIFFSTEIYCVLLYAQKAKTTTNCTGAEKINKECTTVIITNKSKLIKNKQIGPKNFNFT